MHMVYAHSFYYCFACYSSKTLCGHSSNVSDIHLTDTQEYLVSIYNADANNNIRWSVILYKLTTPIGDAPVADNSSEDLSC